MISTNERDTRKKRHTVLGDSQLQFPRDFDLSKVKDIFYESVDEYENKHNVEPQGSLLSSMLSKVSIDLNHRVPALEALDSNGLLSNLGDKFTSFMDWILEFIREYILYITLFFLFAYHASNTRKSAIFYLLLCCWGLIVMYANINSLFVKEEYTTYYPSPGEFNVLYKHLNTSNRDGKLPDEVDHDTDSDEDEEVVSSQGFLDDNVVAESLMLILATLFGLAPRHGGVMVLKEYLKLTPSMKNNVFGTVSSTMNMTSDLCRKMGCDDFLQSIFDIPKVDENVKDFIERINDFINRLHNSTDGTHSQNTVLYDSLLRESKNIESGLTKGSFTHVQLSEALKNLEKAKNNMNRKFASLSGTRSEPVVVFFTGAPSTMKTTLASRFAYMLNMVTLPDESKLDFESNPDTYTYRKSTEKWWDGYTSKANVTLIDDLFQIVDNATEPSSSEAAMLIRMTNSEEFAVPIAEATGKGSIFFRSNFILATSNLPGAKHVNSVHSKDAVRRRLHLYVKVSINKKYLINGTQAINWAVLPGISGDVKSEDELDCKKFPMDFWTLEYNEVNGGVIPSERKNISFPELFKKVVKRYYKHLSNYEINKATERENMYTLEKEIIDSLDASKRNYLNIKAKLSIPQMPGSFLLEPQSGLDTSTVQNSDEAEKFAIDYQKAKDLFLSDWYDYSTDDKSTIINLYVDILYQQDRKAIWSDHPFYEFVESLNIEQLERFRTLVGKYCTVDNNINTIFYFYTSIINDRITNGFDPISGARIKEVNVLEVASKKIVGRLSEIGNFCKKNLPAILIVLSISVATAYGLYKVIDNFVGDPDPQSGITEKYISKGPTRSKKQNSKKSASKETTTNVSQGDDLEYFLTKGVGFGNGVRGVNNNVLTSVVDKYHFIIYIQTILDKTKKTQRLGHCVNVKSNKFLMPYHFILEIEDYLEAHKNLETHIFLVTASGTRKFKVTSSDFLKGVITHNDMSERDICLVSIGTDYLSVGALKFFLDDTKDMSTNHKQFPVTIIGSKRLEDQNSGVVYRVIETSASYHRDEISVKSNWKTNDNITHYTLDRVLKYNGNFSGGDCGSIISLTSTGVGSKIIVGIHLAGTNRYGYCTVISAKDIHLLLSLCDNDISGKSFVEEVEPQGLTLKLKIDTDLEEATMVAKGEFDDTHSTSLCGKSDLIRSIIYNKINFPECVNKVSPALLMPRTNKHGELIDPRVIALNNYARDLPAIPSEILNEARLSYFQIIYRYDNTSFGRKKEIFSVEESLHNFGDHIHSIASSTSAGWPMNTSSTQDVKKLYYKSLFNGDEENRVKALNTIRGEIKKIEELYDQNIRPVFLYSDALKDETRPTEKALAGKTRMFSGCPFYLLIMFRRYFGAFMDYFFDANLDIGSAIGINPYSMDWHELGLNLTQYSRNLDEACVGAGDYSKFDSSECPQILWAIYQIIEAWYDTNDSATTIRTYLWQEIVNSRHIFQNNYYDWKSGMPSGNPMTAIINTMYNNIAFRLAFHYCDCEIWQYNSVVYMCALGDDNIFTTTPEFRDRFNELTMVDAMAKIGLTYTTELKDKASVPFRKITEVEFLKRSFRPIRLQGNMRFLAPINKDSIFSMLHWTKKGKNSEQITCDNISLAIRELSLHGKEEYNKYVPELKRVREEFLPTYKSVHPEYLDYRDTLYAVIALEHHL